MTEIAKDILFEIREIKTDPKSLRRFGIILAVIILIVGLWMWRKDYSWFGEMAVVGFALFGLALIAPKAFLPFYYALTSVSIVIGYFVSRVLLSLIYFIFLAPIGIFARIFGKDLLKQRMDKKALTYWIPKAKNTDTQTYERLY